MEQAKEQRNKTEIKKNTKREEKGKGWVWSIGKQNELQTLATATRMALSMQLSRAGNTASDTRS